MAHKNEYGSNVITEDGVTNDSHLYENDNKVKGYQTQNTDNSKPDEEDDKVRVKKGLYIRDIDGNKPDGFAFRFFDLLNSLAGGIFTVLDKTTGEITLKKGESVEDVKSSSTVSKELGLLIKSNIENEAKQVIFMRVSVNIYLPEIEYIDVDWGPSVAFDSFKTGHVDLADFEKISDRVIQATLIYHFIYERSKTALYEKNKDRFSYRQFRYSHDPACVAELKVLKDMGENVEGKTRMEEEFRQGTFVEYWFDWDGVKITFRHYKESSSISNYKLIRGYED